MCDFGTGDDADLCSWMNVNLTALKWHASVGDHAYWTGGPTADVTYGDSEGKGHGILESY